MNGVLEQTNRGPRLRFERRLGHPLEQVWRAITQPEHLAAWFPDRIVVDRWEVGAPLRFHGAPVPGGSFDGEVRAFEPQRMWEIRWGTDIVRLEIEPDGDGTKLTLFDTIDQVGKAARDAAGWHACLDRLEHHLDGTPLPEAVERWQAVHQGYVEAFGPQAATIGVPQV